MILWVYGKSNGGLDRFYLMEDGCLLRKSKPKTDDYLVDGVKLRFFKRFKTGEQEFDIYKIVGGKVEDINFYESSIESEAFQAYKEFSEQMGGFRKCISLWDNT